MGPKAVEIPGSGPWFIVPRVPLGIPSLISGHRELPGVTAGSRGFSWVPAGHRGFPRELLLHSGFPWVTLGPHGFSWEFPLKARVLLEIPWGTGEHDGNYIELPRPPTYFRAAT